MTSKELESWHPYSFSLNLTNIFKIIDKYCRKSISKYLQIGFYRLVETHNLFRNIFSIRKTDPRKIVLQLGLRFGLGLRLVLGLCECWGGAIFLWGICPRTIFWFFLMFDHIFLSFKFSYLVRFFTWKLELSNIFWIIVAERSIAQGVYKLRALCISPLIRYIFCLRRKCKRITI